MEKTDQINYNESIAHPSAPPTNPMRQNYQEDFVNHQPVGYRDFTNAGPNANINQMPGVVPQPATTFPTYMPPQHNYNNSIGGGFSRNRRQTSSISGGE